MSIVFPDDPDLIPAPHFLKEGVALGFLGFILALVQVNVANDQQVDVALGIFGPFGEGFIDKKETFSDF
jgi:hypothetical protein